MKKEIRCNGRTLLTNIKESAGRYTRCLLAKTMVNGKKIDLTYDVLNDNLVIHQWYLIPADKLQIVTATLKAACKEALA